jgi:hypothetical protein
MGCSGTNRTTIPSAGEITTPFQGMGSVVQFRVCKHLTFPLPGLRHLPAAGPLGPADAGAGYRFRRLGRLS